MQVLIAISGFCPRIGNVPCTTPFDFLFVISIHVPTWGTTLSISTNLFALIFQSTFPRGERHHQPGYHYLLHSFQSTFLCGERRHITRMQLTTLHFNPRSRVGNDKFLIVIDLLYLYFNPRSLVGNDDMASGTDVGGLAISIHVPSWGTTYPVRYSPIWRKFQSTFPRGERRGYIPGYTIFRGFQSTFPRGERRQIFTNILCFFMQ